MPFGSMNVQRVVLFAAVSVLHVGIALAFVKVGSHVRSPDVAAIETHFIRGEEQAESIRPAPLDVSIPTLVVNVTTVQPKLEIQIETAAPVEAHRSGMTASPAIHSMAAPITIESVEYMTPPSPRYPALSKKLREAGTVVLKVLVDERGGPAKIEIADSSGFERLDQAAVEAVASATFRPYVENGAARSVFVMIPIEFGLKRARG